MHGPTAHTFEIDATDTAPSIPPPYEADPIAAPPPPATDSDHESAADRYMQIAAALMVLALLVAR